jgi:hypothetical protein
MDASARAAVGEGLSELSNDRMGGERADGRQVKSVTTRRLPLGQGPRAIKRV